VDGKIYQTAYYNLDAIIAGRELEKLVSISAGVASATFIRESGRSAHFDSRLWLGISQQSVLDYFRWRQADATTPY
jgi:tRNA(His) 5'-end guanylyltransferase